MTVQDILCAISIIFAVVFTALLIFNAKTRRIKFIKNNTVAAAIIFIALMPIAVAMIFLDDINSLKYVLNLLCVFGFPCIMVMLVFMFEKLIAISNKFKADNQNQEKYDK